MGFKTLIAYQKSFALAMKILDLSKKFPVEERYDLTSQIRRSSRSVCAAIAEAYRKRQYVKHWKSKLSDADSDPEVSGRKLNCGWNSPWPVNILMKRKK